MRGMPFGECVWVLSNGRQAHTRACAMAGGSMLCCELGVGSTGVQPQAWSRVSGAAHNALHSMWELTVC